MKPPIWLVEDRPSIADTLVYTPATDGYCRKEADRSFGRGVPRPG
ncbi:hypothetical protein [Serratia sp. AKBS12]|nr:hypothetical protein [Serratia sp. AKBS12]MCS3407293.1 hypothetical protein [Serratia sp. AKBS12]